MAQQTVPINSSPNQQLTVSLNVNGSIITLNLFVYFNEMTGYWLMDIADQFGVPLVSTVPLLTGVFPAANILAPYQYLGIGSAYVINVSGTSTLVGGQLIDYPTSSNLGTDFALIWDDAA